VWRAYVDESESNQRIDPHTYLLAAAILHDHYVTEVRECMALLRPKSGQLSKLHWHDESPLSRKAVMQTIAQIPALHVVVVRTGRPGEPAERRRRKCFERLAHEFAVRGVECVTAEARERKANERELQHFNQLRTSRVIGSQVRLDHVPGPNEPLLWIADAVAGAVTAARTGMREYLDELAGLVDVVTLGS
jgi:hypothetical protein